MMTGIARKTTKHTPGPWEVDEVLFAGRSTGIRGVRTASEDNLVTIPGSHCVSYTRIVAEIPWGDTLSNPAHLADARLIAAAPDLLVALTKVMEWIDSPNSSFTTDEYWPQDEQAARAAIEKATT